MRDAFGYPRFWTARHLGQIGLPGSHASFTSLARLPLTLPNLGLLSELLVCPVDWAKRPQLECFTFGVGEAEALTYLPRRLGALIKVQAINMSDIGLTLLRRHPRCPHFYDVAHLLLGFSSGQ